MAEKAGTVRKECQGGRMAFLQRVCICMVGIFCMAAAIVMPQAMAADAVQAIVITGEIDGSQAALVQRGIAQAEENQDKAVMLIINTQGGRVSSALKIRDMMQRTSLPTIAYVTSRAWSAGALIALSCRHIIMAPGSSIGAAEPIPNSEKNIAALKSEFSATANAMGHNPSVAEAMVDKTDGFPDYAEPGKILSLTDKQAKELNVSEGTADSPEDALRFFSMGNASVQYEEQNWKDQIVGILQNEYVRMVFIALILAAIFLEIKMAGMGIGVVTAFVLGGMMLITGEESLTEDIKVLAAFIGSFVCIALELAAPGAGIFGVVGVLLLFGSLFYMLGATVDAVYILAGGTVLALVLFYGIGKKLPQSRLLSKIMLKNRSTKEKGYTSHEDKSSYLYKRGKTITDLKPSGFVRIDGKRVEAKAAGSEYIPRDTAIRVVKTVGYCITVEPVPKRDA